MRRLLAALLILFVVGAPAAAHADTSDFTFDSFQVDYALSADADGTARLQVVETIVARFPDFDQNRGLIRAIPDDYDGVPLGTTVSSVTDADGIPVFYTEERIGDFVELALGTDEFVRGVQTYVITYEQINVVRSFDDTESDEFYWDVNGTGWDQPFGAVSMTLAIDPALVPALTGDAACYQGYLGENNPCTIEGGPDVFTAAVTDLAPAQTLTVAVGFDPGTFVTPEPTPSLFDRPTPWWSHLLSGGVLALALGLIVTAAVLRVRAGRSAPGRGTIIAQYSEPKDVTILQSAHLVGRGWTALPAALVRLAVRRHLRILAYPVDAGVAEPYTLQFLTTTGAEEEELALLTALFGTEPQPGALRRFGRRDQTLMSALSSISTAAHGSLITRGLQRKPQGVGLGLLMPVALFALIFVSMAVIFVTAVAGSISDLILAAIIISFIGVFITIPLAWRPRTLTATGAEARDYLQGIKMYLDLAEKDRLQMLQSATGADRVDVTDELQLVKLYEKLLPWAVLWGVETSWMTQLAVHVDAVAEKPDWIVGTSGFQPTLLTGTLGGFRTTITPPSTSSNGWRGSSGGSFSGGSRGGGFSGGGGGGGGGRGR
jgi:uncharacterized membrane protein YgcG